MDGLAERVVLVTGGASGIGKGIAEVFGAYGAHVAVGDLDQKQALAVAEQLEGAASVLGVEMDVTDRTSTDRAVSTIEEELGPVEVLVNNAGISSATPFLAIGEEELDRILEVNLKGVFIATQRVLPGMLERGRGRIVNISSMAGKEGLSDLSHYCASKFGVIGMTQSLAKEVAARGVTVNAVCPGVVRTPLWDDPATGILGQMGGEPAWDAFVVGIPLGRPQSAQDMGYACAFLASDHAANITGESLNVSGGQQMH